MMTPPTPDQTCKPGRPRSGACREAILQAALELVEETGFNQVTIESIAQRAGVGKTTIYRWWPDKAHVVIDAFFESTSPTIPFPNTGDVCADFTDQMLLLTALFRGPKGKLIATLLMGAQHDPSLAKAFRERWLEPRRKQGREVIARAKERGQLAQDVDPELLMDALYSPVYLRMLAGHQPIDAAFARSIVSLVLKGSLIGSGAK